MLKVIKRVLRLSGDLSKRIYASFVFSFIDSIMAMFPVGAVFYTLTKIQNNKAFAGNDWLVTFWYTVNLSCCPHGVQILSV